MDPLPTSAAAAIGDAAAEGLQLVGQLYGYKNTPEEHNAELAQQSATRADALRAALAANDINALRILLTPATT